MRVGVYFGDGILIISHVHFFKKKILFIHFRERGREREREREKHQCVVASNEPPTGHVAHNLAMCPDWESNLQTFDMQACAQSAELHQTGHL